MPGEGPETKPISLFYSYSHKDEELRNELADHLVPLERAGLIEVRPNFCSDSENIFICHRVTGREWV